MSKTLPNMLESTIAKIREMVDVNSVIGTPITTPDGVTIIPVSKVSVGFGGGGSDFVSKNVNKPRCVSHREGRLCADAACGDSSQYHCRPDRGAGAGCAGQAGGLH